MALVTKITKTIELPHEPGESMDIRKLSGKQLEEAREKRSDATLVRMRAMGVEFVNAAQQRNRERLEGLAGVSADEVDEAASDPLNDYDKWVVLFYGIASWSYKDKLPTQPHDRYEIIYALDEVTAEHVAREIVVFSAKPKAEAEKNG